MLNTIKIKTLITAGMFALLPLSAMAQVASEPVTAGIPQGTYKGRFHGARSGRVHLIAEPIAGCQSCFMATVIVHVREGLLGLGQSNDQVRIYKAVPKGLRFSNLKNGKIAPVSYTLTPIQVDGDGELIESTNPSLVLGIYKNAGTDEVEFSNVQANDVNQDVFNSAMVFNDQLCRNEEDEIESGLIFKEWHDRSSGTLGLVTVSEEDGVTRFASITDFGGISKGTSGNFQIEEKAPNVFTYQRDAAYATGDIVSEYPDKLIVFIRRAGQDKILVIDPNNSSNVREIKIHG